MQSSTKCGELKPFHETIVGAIGRASTADAQSLATLIKVTSISENHDAIIAAWKKRTEEMYWGGEDLGVPASLLSQKQANEKKFEGTKKSINLDELQQRVKQLLALLKDRQPGLMGWNMFMQERLQDLHCLTSQALGKQ